MTIARSRVGLCTTKGCPWPDDATMHVSWCLGYKDTEHSGIPTHQHWPKKGMGGNNPKAKIVSILCSYCHDRIDNGSWGNAVLTLSDGTKLYRAWTHKNETVCERSAGVGDGSVSQSGERLAESPLPVAGEGTAAKVHRPEGQEESRALPARSFPSLANGPGLIPDGGAPGPLMDAEAVSKGQVLLRTINSSGNYPLHVGRRKQYTRDRSARLRWRWPMTVCIAAISGQWTAPAIIAATDKMRTAGDVQFEGKAGKTFAFTSTVVALGAGDSSDELEICRRALARVQAAGLTEVQEIAESFAETYRTFRQEVFERELLSPYKLTLDEFNLNQRALTPEFAERIQRLVRDRYLPMSDRDFGCSTIIAGVDASGPHLYVVRDPGQVSCEDSAGFAAVGSGARHAETYLMLDGYSPDTEFWHGVLTVYSAKRQSENAPFVGPATELIRLDATGLGVAQEAEITNIESVYQNNLKAIKEAGQEAKTRISEVMGGLSERTKPAQPGEAQPPPPAEEANGKADDEEDV